MKNFDEKISLADQNHSDPEVRLQFIDKISQVKSQLYLPQLIDLMGDKEWRVRKSAVVAVSHLEKNENLVKRLIQVLELEGNVGQRNAAEEALIQIGNFALRPLLDRLPEANSDVKKMIIEIVGALKDSRAIIPLTKITEDPDDNVKLAAVESLGKLKNPAALDCLFEILKSENILLKFVTVKALKEIGDPRSVVHLLQVLNHKAVERPVMESLGGFSDPRVQEPIFNAIENSVEKVKDAALGSLYEHYHRLDQEGKEKFRSRVSEKRDSFPVSFLLKSLENPKEKVQAGAMYLLTWLKASKAARSIAVLLDGPLKDEAVQSLVALGPSSEKDLVELIPKSTESVREGIARVLGEFKSKKSKDALKGLLSDSSGHVRERVADALGRSEDNSSTKDLLKLLSDPYKSVQGSAIDALGKVQSDEVLEGVNRMLKSENPQLRSNAATVLGKLKIPMAVEKLILCLKDESPKVRKAAVGGLGNSDDSRVKEHLLQSMTDEDKSVRLSALLEVMKIPDVDLIKVFKPMLNDNDIWVRSTVARGLGEIKTQAAESLLLELLKDKVGVVKIAAIEGLGKTGNLGLSEKIIAEAKSGDLEVARAALEALGKLRAKEGIPVLREFLKHPKWGIRNSAVKALGRIGGGGIAEEIEKLSKNDPDRLVRKSAVEALDFIKKGS